MKPRLRPKLNYANVIATIALFVALGGAAVAAGLPKNSVGPNQLKRGAVTTAKIRKAAVTSGKLAPKSVVAGKLGPSSVTPGNIGNGAITTSKLAAGSVIASTIKNGVITTNKLQNEAVNSAKLGKESVTLAKLDKDVPPLLGTLKSGQTLRGVFDVGGGGSATTTGDASQGAVSYQFPLASTPTAEVLKIGETSANCAGLGGGNNQTPQAAPGRLCIYVTGFANVDFTGTPINTVNDSRLGFGLEVRAGADGSSFAAYGLWAVTAP